MEQQKSVMMLMDNIAESAMLGAQSGPRWAARELAAQIEATKQWIDEAIPLVAKNRERQQKKAEQKTRRPSPLKNPEKPND